jgi:DNA-binding NtrC family response regulator
VIQAKTTSKRLLFVDDEPKIRETLAIILRRYGFSVTLAATVSEALEHIKKDQFDLLLCDLNIEKSGDGYTVVHAIREVNPYCVVIILTGYPGFDSAVEGIRHGVDDYLVKPANADALVALLAHKLIERRKRTKTLDTESIRRRVYASPKLGKLRAGEVSLLRSQAAEGNTEAKELLDFLGNTSENDPEA